MIAHSCPLTSMSLYRVTSMLFMSSTGAVLSSGIFAPPHIAAAIGAMLEHSEKIEPHRSDDTDHDVFLHDVFPHDVMAQMVASDDEACLKSRGLPLTDSYTSAPPLKKHSSALELSALALF